MNPRTLILGTAGHIDHGKTALVRAMTGIDTDRLPQEKQRGITIDIGFANLDLGAVRLGIVDVPGHERFIKNMLAGAVGIDVALLVVAADDSVMPQTREHLAILGLLGVRHGLVTITKCDRVEPAWVDLVEEEIRRLAAGTFLKDAPIVRTAVPADGPPQGIDRLRDAIGAVCEQVIRHSERDVFRLPIDRAFSVQGLGTIVTGTVWSGQLRVRDEVEWHPSGKKLVVRGLQNHGHETDLVEAGQRAAVNLSGAHHREVVRGHEIATPGYLASSKLLTVEVQVLGDSPRAVRHRSRQRLYLGTQEVMVVVALLEKARIEPGQRGLAQLHCAQAATSAAGQPFVMRAESPLVTIGGGRVLQAQAKRITRRQTGQIERLRALSSLEDAERTAAAIYFFGAGDWTDLDLCRDARLAIENCGPIIDQLTQAGTIIELAVKPRRTCRIHRDVVEDAERRIVKLVEQLHAEAALRTAIERDRVVALYGAGQNVHLAEAIIDRLLARRLLSGDHRTVALAGYAPRLSTAQVRLRQRILSALREAGLKPPTPAELARATSTDEKEVRQILGLCADEGELVPLAGGLYLHREIEAAMRDQLRARLEQAGGLTVSQIKDLLGTSRKFAVPICEHLDRIGLTRRDGDLRVLR
ncbi:MAG: selenocysteine-specific translation elongation factor [Pirellulales bacterium]